MLKNRNVLDNGCMSVGGYEARFKNLIDLYERTSDKVSFMESSIDFLCDVSSALGMQYCLGYLNAVCALVRQVRYE